MASIGINTDLDFSAPTSTTPAVGASKILKLVTASRAVVSNASGDLAASAVTATELGYLSGVTSAIQTQITAISAPFADTQTIIKGSADATKLLRFEVDGFTTGQTRVLTPPDANIVIAGSASALTSGRIPYATTGGLLTDVSTLQWNGTTLVAANVKAGQGVASNTEKFMVNTPSGVQAGMQFFQDGVESWTIFNPASSTDLRFSASGNERMRLTTAGLLGVNSTGLTARFTVTSSTAAEVSAILKGAASQSANLTEWQNSSGTVLTAFNSAGKFGTFAGFAEAVNIVVGTTTGTKIGTSTSQKIGFWNATPVVRPSAYTPTNVTTDRAYDANSTTLDEVADVLGTLIADLQSIGLIG